MVSIYLGDLLTAQFVERINRFLCTVEVNGSLKEVHLHDPGRLKELLLPQTTVFLRKENAPHRKTQYDLVCVLHNGLLVCCDSRVPNKLVKKALHQKALDLPDYTRITPEYTYSNSRLDFCLDTILLEVKGVTLVRDGLALFPDAPTERGRKHVKTLMSALQEGFQSYILFLVQRPDAHQFSPNKETDPEFAQTLLQAVKKGVNILVYTSEIVGNHMYLREKILSIIL